MRIRAFRFGQVFESAAYGVSANRLAHLAGSITVLLRRYALLHVIPLLMRLFCNL